MTRDQAIEAALEEAKETGRAQTVFRFPAWRTNSYAVRATEQLPSDALRFETFTPEGELGSATPSLRKPAVTVAPSGGQGSLF